MGLYDRVQQAGAALETPAAPGFGELLERLRGALQQDVSVERLAQLTQENPDYARGEVRSSCRRIFQEPDWVAVSDGLREQLTEKLLAMIFGFGVIEDLLSDESITEIAVNGTDRIFIERNGILEQCDRSFASEQELRALIDRILGPLGKRIDEASPMVDARTPQGYRVNAVVPPVAMDGPSMTIRKFSDHVITLDEMEKSGSVEPAVSQFLRWAVCGRKSIAVCGGTGSGKTTLLNALSCVIPPQERIVTIEDSAELRFWEHPDVVRLEARPRNAEGLGEITIRSLVINALRMRPDRIVVGECRGAEALDMLQAMNTGHDGSLTTLHANSPADAIARLTTMVRYEADLPVDVIEANIASAIDLAVQTERAIDGSRRLCRIVAFSFDQVQGRCVTQDIYLRPLGSDEGRWLSAPEWLSELSLRNIASEEEVREWMQTCCLSR